MSSDKSVMPIVCERCGHLELTRAAEAAQANDNTARRVGKCPACGHGWSVPTRSEQITVRRKPDRRRIPRDK
jgi:ribosomal protein L37E